MATAKTPKAPKTKTPKKSNSGGKNPNEAPDIDGLERSTRDYYKIDARIVTGSHKGNHRDIFAQSVYDAGYDLFNSLTGHPELPPLWELATSEDLAKRAEFLRVMELHEGTNPADPTILDLAVDMNSGVAKQINPVVLTFKGNKKGGKPQVDVVAGHRRLVAALWLWCKGLSPKGPFVEAFFQRGNSLDLSALQKNENALRKAVSPIIVAEGYRKSLNEGASLEQVAHANGVSEQTIERWLKFLELEPKEQEKLKAGKLRHEDAVQIVDDRRAGGDGKTADNLTAEEAAEQRPAKGGRRRRKAGKWSTKKIEATYNAPPADWKGVKADQIKFVLGVILGIHDTTGTAISEGTSGSDEGDASDDGSPDAVLPPDGVAIGLLDDTDELIVDDHGDLVPAAKK